MHLYSKQRRGAVVYCPGSAAVLIISVRNTRFLLTQISISC
jgi:hypothetical protein